MNHSHSYLLSIVCLLSICTPWVIAQTWSDADAAVMLRLSYSSYCSAASINRWDCPYCTMSGTPSMRIVSVMTSASDGTQGFVGYYGSTIVVAYRGSTDLQNWVENLDFAKTSPWSDVSASVHAGFWQAYSSLKSSTFSAISGAKNACPGCTRIFFTGHSLGGAMATLAAVEFARSSSTSGLELNALVLGSPRVGDSKFANYAASKITNLIRWTHSSDIVVHLPPTLMGFSHPPREVWETKSESYKVCSATNGEDSSCADSISILGLSITPHTSYGNIQLNSASCATLTLRDDTVDGINAYMRSTGSN